MSSSPVKSSGGGPVSTKPSSPGTVPGRLKIAGFKVDDVLDVEEEIPELVFVAVFVVVVPDEPPLVEP